MATTRTTPKPTASSPRGGEGSYRAALDERTQQLLGQLVAGDYQSGPVSPVALMLGAARIVNELGMPLRHAAARQAIACYSAEYLRHFAFHGSCFAGQGADGAPLGLLWRVPAELLAATDDTADPDAVAEGVVLDVVRCVGLDTPVVTDAVRERSVALLQSHLADPALAGLPLLGVRICVLGAPRLSVLLDVHGQLRPLTTTRLWGSTVRATYAQLASDQHPAEIGTRVPAAVLRAAGRRATASATRRSA